MNVGTWLGRGLIVSWSLLVLFLFVSGSPSLAVVTPRSLAILGEAMLLLYGLCLTGYRVRRAIETRWEYGPGPLEATVLEFGLGAGAFSAVLFLIGILGLYGPWSGWGLIALALVGPHRAFVKDVLGRLRLGDSERADVCLRLTLAVCAALAIVQGLAPVTAQDALAYHLALPARYVEAGGIAAVDGNFFAQFPQNMEMLYTLGLLIGHPEVAQLVHGAFGVAATLAVACLARCLGAGASAWLAAAAFGTIPSVCLLASWPYVDLGVAFYTTVSTVCFVRWHGSGRGRWLVAAAVFAGLAAGCKYTGGFQGILLVAGTVLVSRDRGRRALFLAGGVALIVGAIASPWLIRNVLETGNPFYPFAYGIFGGRGWDSERAAALSTALAEWGGGRGWLDTIILPWRVTMASSFASIERFDGVIGCAFLAALPLLLAATKTSARYRLVLAFCIAHAAFWVVTTRQVRFLLPSLACASALLGAAAPVVVGPGWSRAMYGWVLKAALVANVLVTGIHFARQNPLPVVLGMEDERAYLERELPGGDYAVFDHIARELPPDCRILFGSLGGPGFLCRRPYHADAIFENRTLLRLLREARDADSVLAAFRREGFTHLLFKLECVFDPSGTKSDLPIEEQLELQSFLNRHGRLVARAGGTYLYEIGRDAGGESSRRR